MDCFYAAVELRDKPYLKHKPVAVGGKEARGIITTCNYEARKFGVRSAMPAGLAKQLCPNLVFLNLRFDAYREESKRIFKIISAMHPNVSMTSVDEGFVNLDSDPSLAFEQARRIKESILEQTGLVVSLGIAPNKMLAKICSAAKKPDALFLLKSENVLEFMSALPVKRIPGVGPKAQEKLSLLGIETCEELQRVDPDTLAKTFGEWGYALHKKAFGGLLSSQEFICSERSSRKSVSLERTLPTDLLTYDDIKNLLPGYYKQLRSRLKNYRSNGGNEFLAKAFVKLKFNDFSKTSCETTFPTSSTDICSIETFEELLFEALSRSIKSVRLVGLGLRFEDPSANAARSRAIDPRQLELWPKHHKHDMLAT